MPGWFDKLKDKAQETLHDQEKMDRIRGKVEETLHDPEKMDRIKGTAERALDRVTHHSPETSAGAVESLGAERGAAEMDRPAGAEVASEAPYAGSGDLAEEGMYADPYGLRQDEPYGANDGMTAGAADEAERGWSGEVFEEGP